VRKKTRPCSSDGSQGAGKENHVKIAEDEKGLFAGKKKKEVAALKDAARGVNLFRGKKGADYSSSASRLKDNRGPGPWGGGGLETGEDSELEEKRRGFGIRDGRPPT